ncbi:hypothetical protein [Acidiphilium sp.]|uniref:hypothetical protein n=1 Tax=Acidiphilium sp. TaxID=527 RepID=UPI003D039DB2
MEMAGDTGNATRRILAMLFVALAMFGALALGYAFLAALGPGAAPPLLPMRSS